MVDDTANLDLPYIIASQAKKHITHNEALRKLDVIVQLAIIDRDLIVPPSSPNDADRYLIASGANGDWNGKDNQIAAWQDGAWMFHIPKAGWSCWVIDEDIQLIWDGSIWVENSGASLANPTPLVGVNTSADITNRLAVSSPNSLFTHEGDSHRIKINKASSSDTASFFFQNNWSGRAEFGLTGDDDFHVKVSADGSTWR